MSRMNDYGQPIGEEVALALPRPRPEPVVLEGRLVRLEPLRPDHASGLFARVGGTQNAALWTYMPQGPFPDAAGFEAWITGACDSRDPLFFAIAAQDGGAVLGFASFLRITPEAGSIEVGFIMFSGALQGTAMATEAMALMMGHAFDTLGYRRYEWKCDALNGPSRRAAERLGFSYEGTFRQATVYKGRNRDTAWFAATDRDWPRLRAGFAAWLAPENFDADGRQRCSLAECRG
ncbi:GNAT family N-acetyltransferase [Mangrovicoccus algicola]|uniref:GNAT family N-acetyltransferase n=1 Tax=Mangrovicoccus algicola TaxID=2771008 RepID=A0A8J6Z970_9RHOB|nr:GNAT family protein [Mangrovicoccus algicola]MBE3638585.1 GNAT family N-acetyltransferase [Mangrovicoccus algicola]